VAVGDGAVGPGGAAAVADGATDAEGTLVLTSVEVGAGAWIEGVVATVVVVVGTGGV
jgi:hypothetical protein